MVCFRWISPRRLPAEFDLRARGWRLAPDGEPDAARCVRLIDALSFDPFDLLPPARPSCSLALGIADSRERALWLWRGFGDALAWETGLDEIAARATRLVLPNWERVRSHGSLQLDPITRDVAVEGRRLRLFPREFALLWRLSEEPGVAVPRAELLHDVFGLTIEPGTNALAVHICRLRKKLHTARLSHLLVTDPCDGGYALLLEPEPPQVFGWRNGLDESGFSGEEITLIEEAAE